MPAEPRPTPGGLIDVSAERGPLRRLADVIEHRTLLVNLIRRDLRVRYKGSALGFLWSLLSPAMYLVVFSLVFKEFLKVDIPAFGIFLLSGLLAWNFLAGSLNTAVVSLTENRALVQKVWFPREVLPLASVGASLVNLVLQAIVLAVGLALFQHRPAFEMLWLLIPALAVLTVFATGLSLIVAALNVGLRDVKHLIDVGLTAWFWVSAIVYPYATVAARLGTNEWVASLNPMVPIVVTFQRVLYDPPAASATAPAILPDVGTSWYLGRLGIELVVAAVILWLGLIVFARQEKDFGDQL